MHLSVFTHPEPGLVAVHVGDHPTLYYYAAFGSTLEPACEHIYTEKPSTLDGCQLCLIEGKRKEPPPGVVDNTEKKNPAGLRVPVVPPFPLPARLSNWFGLLERADMTVPDSGLAFVLEDISGVKNQRFADAVEIDRLLGEWEKRKEGGLPMVIKPDTKRLTTSIFENPNEQVNAYYKYFQPLRILTAWRAEVDKEPTRVGVCVFDDNIFEGTELELIEATLKNMKDLTPRQRQKAAQLAPLVETFDEDAIRKLLVTSDSGEKLQEGEKESEIPPLQDKAFKALKAFSTWLKDVWRRESRPGSAMASSYFNYLRPGPAPIPTAQVHYLVVEPAARELSIDIFFFLFLQHRLLTPARLENLSSAIIACDAVSQRVEERIGKVRTSAGILLRNVLRHPLKTGIAPESMSFRCEFVPAAAAASKEEEVV